MPTSVPQESLRRAISSTSSSPSLRIESPVNVKWFGASGDGVTDDSAAVQRALTTGAKSLYFPRGTYLVKDCVISSEVLVFGDGAGVTILKSVPVTITGLLYSRNILTATAALDSVTLRDLTIDGAGTGIGMTGESSLVPLLLLSTVKKVRFENVTVTKYSGGYVDTLVPIKDWLFYAVVIRYAESVDFLNCLLADNNYEQVLIYNNEASECPVTILGCKEINSSATPASHSAFTTVGGRIMVSSWFSNNTAYSTLSIQLPKSASVTASGFYNMRQLGAGYAIDFGQSSWGPNNNISLSDLTFTNCDEGAVSTGWANSVTMKNLKMEYPGLVGIKCYSDLDPISFAAHFPDWTPPVYATCYGLRIKDCFIFGVKNSGGVSGAGIRIGHSGSLAGQRYVDVQCTGNEISAGVAPYDTLYCLSIDGVQDGTFSRNYLNYAANALLVAGPSERIRISDGNVFASNQLTSGYDILLTGAFAAAAFEVSRNTFVNSPLGGAGNLIAAGGCTLTDLLMLDNRGLHPRYQAVGVTGAVVRSTRKSQLATTPAAEAGIWAIGDVGLRAPTAGQPEKYVATAPGSYTAQTGTGTGVNGQYRFEASNPGELALGAVVSLVGGFTAAAVLMIVGTTVYIDKPMIATIVVPAALSVVNPTLVASANMA